MHHTSARTAISHLLAAKGFGERGLALVLAAACGDADDQAVQVRQAALASAGAMPQQTVTSYVGELLYAPIPTDEKELCRQLCPATVAMAKNVGLQVACLAGLVTLWPHISSSERALMRQRFLDGLASDRSPTDMHVSSQQLITWQRDLPTAKNEPHASLSTLKGLLQETTPKDAYRVMSDHLGINAHLATVSWVLGSLAIQVRLRRHDPDNYLLHVLLGTAALERLTPTAPPEHLATLLAQLGHQLWWCEHDAQLAPIRTCVDHNVNEFHQAITSGNLTAAQRAARTLAQRPADFWETAWSLVNERLQANDPQWHSALALVLVTAWRTNTDMVSPDDAAAVGTVLADLSYRDKPAPALTH